MYLIVGLGNPEPEYSNTRHNMGFDVINALAKEYKIEINRNKFSSLYGTGVINDEKVILIKPQTFMNLSGHAIRDFINFYKLDKDNIIIIYDDIDIKKGTIKVRKIGGAGTHNGMKSVIEEIKTEEFARIRVGTGSPIYKNDLINYVLEKLPEDERKLLEPGLTKAKEAVKEILKNGIDSAMNKFN